MQEHSIEERVLKPKKGQRTKCDQCDFETNCIKKFVTHLLEAHRNKHASYKCSFCEFVTEGQNNLDIHMVKSHDMLVVLNGLAENQRYAKGSHHKNKSGQTWDIVPTGREGG